MPVLLTQSNGHAEAAITLPHLGRDLPAERRLDDVFDIGDVEAVTRSARPIDFNLQLRHLARPVHERARDAWNGLNRVKHLFGLLTEDDAILAEDLDDDLSVNLRDAFEDVVPDRL